MDSSGYSTGNYDLTQGMNTSNPGTAPAAAAAGGNPALMAGIMLGGQFLANLMNQQAQVNAQKKSTMVGLDLQQGQNQSDTLNQLANNYRGIR